MTNNETKVFINEMERLKDIWTEKQVMDVYGSFSLQEALLERKKELRVMNTILNKAMKGKA